ncbi:hypothetical protein JHD47_06585 [Sulfurimonas sp. SAG-AH-194-L11]|nr:hypothetical protein [Sulfurimonas sp. SAG-AH-194-L11]MDF1877480.1 hypothetical protein [Sulfurimonas sp. SAG-AH-194-L11]
MSYADEEIKKTYVITYKELIFTFLMFSVILIVLFPKDILKEQILAENSNYDLSMLYLKNLLKHSPEDESLMLILAEQSLRSGKRDLSLRLLELLLKSKNMEYRYKANILSYDLQKDDYFYLQTELDRAKQMKKLRKLFATIYTEKMYDAKNIDKWFEEANFVGNTKARYFLLKQKLLKTPKNIALLEEGYYLAQQSHKRKDARKFLKLLQKYDPARSEKWALDEYNMNMAFKDYVKAEKVLLQKAKTSIAWQERLADFYLMSKSYRTASQEYMSLYHKTKTYRGKKRYFYKAVKALQAGNHLKEAAKLVHKYERVYLSDKSARRFMLKIYLATGNLEYAANLSKKILKREYK